MELALIGLALAWLAFWLAQALAEHVTLPPLPRRTPPAPRVPHWARTGHLPPSSAASGRHRRGGTR